MQHVVVDKLPSSGTGWLAYVPIAASVIAAISACLSWLSVRQARMVWRTSLEPELVPVLRIGEVNLHLTVINIGKAVAAEPGWAVLWMGQSMEGRLPDHAISPNGQTSAATLATRGSTDRSAKAIVWCRGTDGGLLVWSTTRGPAQRFSREQIKDKEPVHLLAEVFDYGAHDATNSTLAGDRLGPFASR